MLNGGETMPGRFEEVPMYRVQLWLKKKEGMTADEFRDHWLERHAPIARDGYQHLRGYMVNLVTGAPRGQEPIYDGVAELSWESRDDFVSDMKSDAARSGAEDLERFTEGFGMVFIDQHQVK
jgi:uncharacterized protein (TIGR02118 family)